MSQKNVLVLFGGASPEHDVSMNSAGAVIGALGKHNVIPVYITREGKWLLYDGKLDNVHRIDWEKYGTTAVLSPDRVNRGLLRIVGDKVKTLPVDVVFPVLHGQNGEDGTIQGLCQLAEIPFVGSGVTASAIGMDKGITKLIARSLKIPQADFLVIDREELEYDLKGVMRKVRYKPGYPCFVKPVNCGSSVGITKANDRNELMGGLAIAASISQRVIIEKAVAGREIQLGILGSGQGVKVSVPGEITYEGDFYDYEAKYKKATSKTIAPAKLSEEQVTTLQKYALDIFRAIGCKGMLRADFFISEDDKVLFNEVNTIPGFTDISMFAKVWKASGLQWHNLVDELIMSSIDNDEE